jgi:MoaA/NifB/PqqE/SkfB family radical SAM enzyme
VIVRFEPWGAWVKLETTPALIALDHDGVRALGVTWREPRMPRPPLEVHLAVTGRCAAGCEGCYLDARPDGKEPPREDLVAVLQKLKQEGVFTVAFGGGEPTTRGDLHLLAETARDLGLTPVLTTSGLGLGKQKIDRLRAFAQVNVSYDGPSQAYAAVRGFDGAREAEEAIAALSSAGIRVGVNIVLTRASFEGLATTFAMAKHFGALETQLLRYKPAGRARSLDYLAKRLTLAQAESLGPTLRRLVDILPTRIDCALVPFLSADPTVDGEALARHGVFGCEAAAALSAIDVDGNARPCSFAPAGEMDAWRSYVAPEPCASCELRAVCKGGCKVVSRYVDGVHGPDPECPRVRRWRA